MLKAQELLCSPRLHLLCIFDQKHRKTNNMKCLYIYIFFLSAIYSYNGKVDFFLQPLLQLSVSHHLSEIILICRFGAQEFFFYYYQC